MKRQYCRFWWIDNGQQFVQFLIDAGTPQKRNHNYYRVTINTKSFFCRGFVANHSQITVSIFLFFFSLFNSVCLVWCVEIMKKSLKQTHWCYLNAADNVLIWLYFFVVVVVVLYCSLQCTCIRTKTNLLLGFPLKPYLMPESRF